MDWSIKKRRWSACILYLQIRSTLSKAAATSHSILLGPYPMFIPFPNPMNFFKFCRGSNDESTSKPSSKVYKPRKRSIKAGDSKRTKPAKPANRAATSSRLSTPAKVPSESSEPQLQPTKSTGKTIDDDAELRAKLQIRMFPSTSSACGMQALVKMPGSIPSQPSFLMPSYAVLAMNQSTT
ncbi:hypothetical protein AUEXF2481DRAFT_218522 [Aureobasidium subglaciale EXF-2481]|uniref:Uncharacterized protein n=1 Tax=Aureobasidium subglaciale (strain EXF-2481) TaxID=1043005 RepID=A0A074YH72_AURSE|nr:uncharacterized protein AUEXF2481DRAFT_218522 [Aureobasidium subglaciale EXF-2481]KEQ95434.1 hypothetical protein AUEXF2481DRAFT_218522 [Aureobasidium subglaciale EXF-2481]